MSLIVRSADSAHWYRTDGAPQYTVSAKDGSDRPTTLRDARQHKLVPSVTTILKVAAKPGLEAWKQEQMLLAALTLPRVPGESEQDLIARIVTDSKETARRAAERGTRVHEAVEAWFKGEPLGEYEDISKAVVVRLKEHFGEALEWKTETSFASSHGYGGKIDLHTDPTEHLPTGAVVDVKTKEFDATDKIAAYDEHLMQLAAYRYGLGLPKARCANVFVSVTNPGLLKIIEWSNDDLIRGWEMFRCLLSYWKLKNNFGLC